MATREEITQELAAARAQLPADWMQVLQREIESDQRGKLGVAERMGVSRVYVSRVATGHIAPAEVSPRFIARLLESVDAIECPHTHGPMPPSRCRSNAARTYESLSFAEVDHWRACQGCVHNPLNRADQRGGATN